MKNNSMVASSSLPMLKNMMKVAEFESEVKVVLVAPVAEVKSAPEAELELETEHGLKAELQHMTPYMARYRRDKTALNISSLLVDKSLVRLSS
ncbi:hypothetical protein CRG98_042725 [Punica granatum]|nr:hypothetical protein CRG98_042725 [Punica granatum]